MRGRGSVQAPGVAGSKGGVLAATVELEVGRGRALSQGGARQPAEEEKEEEEPIVLDDMFRKTDAKPSLYWLPLSEEEVGAALGDKRGWVGVIVLRLCILRGIAVENALVSGGAPGTASVIVDILVIPPLCASTCGVGTDCVLLASVPRR